MPRNRLRNKSRRIKSANERKNSRTPQEQLNILDKRLGKDIGAVKERARLKKLIEK